MEKCEPMPPEQIDKLSINLGFMEAQAVGPLAVYALVIIIFLLLGWTLLRLQMKKRGN
jgi:hypothetical protein